MRFLIANELLPDGTHIKRNAIECCNEDKKKTFLCPYCGIKVFLNLPKLENKISPYFSAGSERHKRGCVYYKKCIIQKVSHLDQTGDGVSLEELPASFKIESPGKGLSDAESSKNHLRQQDKKNITDEENSLILRVARHPKTILELYGILVNRSFSKSYAGQSKEKIIVDQETISYHYDHPLNHIALVVCKRCRPPKEITDFLNRKRIYGRSLTVRAPYPVPPDKKAIYYILVFSNNTERKEIMDMFIQQQGKKENPKYIAIAEWHPCLPSSRNNVYIGHLPNKACFHILPHVYDCDPDCAQLGN